jgi:hypothetical protein
MNIYQKFLHIWIAISRFINFQMLCPPLAYTIAAEAVTLAGMGLAVGTFNKNLNVSNAHTFTFSQSAAQMHEIFSPSLRTGGL